MDRVRVVFVLQFQTGLFMGWEGEFVRSLRKAGRHEDPDNLMDTARFQYPGEAYELHRLIELVD